jgi:hypothetical protein
MAWLFPVKQGTACKCSCVAQRCGDSCATNYNSEGTDAVCDDKSCCIYPTDPVTGCTDPAAQNYNKCAKIDDNSCVIFRPCGPEECCPGEDGTNPGRCTTTGIDCVMCAFLYAPNGPNCACVYVGEL